MWILPSGHADAAGAAGAAEATEGALALAEGGAAIGAADAVARAGGGLGSWQPASATRPRRRESRRVGSGTRGPTRLARVAFLAAMEVHVNVRA